MKSKKKNITLPPAEFAQLVQKVNFFLIFSSKGIDVTFESDEVSGLTFRKKEKVIYHIAFKKCLLGTKD